MIIRNDRLRRILGASIGLLVLSAAVSGPFAAEAPLAVAPRITPEILRNHNPYDGRKRHCAAFARYALYLLNGKRYITYGSARRWARHAVSLGAMLPLAWLAPGDLLFFKDGRHRVNHVAVVLQLDYADPDQFAITFQDERGTHCWVFPESEPYLNMIPVFGANPDKLETIDMGSETNSKRPDSSAQTAKSPASLSRPL